MPEDWKSIASIIRGKLISTEVYIGVKPHPQGQHERMNDFNSSKVYNALMRTLKNKYTSLKMYLGSPPQMLGDGETHLFLMVPTWASDRGQLRLVFQITRNITPLTLIMCDVTKLWYIIWFYKWLQQWTFIPNTSKIWITMLTRKWICCIFVEIWNGAGGMEMTMEIL